MRFAFPDHNHPPPAFRQLTLDLSVSPYVSCELVPPEGSARSGRIRVLASTVAVPEAAMHEDNRSKPRECQVGVAGQIRTIETKTVAKAVDRRTNCSLGASVLPLDSAHVPASPLWTEAIHETYTTPDLDSTFQTHSAIWSASSGGTALPTCLYCSVRGPEKK